MNQKVMKEIDRNLYIRSDLKSVFDGFKVHYQVITNVNHMLVELKFDFIEKGVYDDLVVFLFYLRNINYLTFSELRYVLKALDNSDKEYFKEDSADMKKLINKMAEKIKLVDLSKNEEIEKLYLSCKDRYERYILQRALFTEDIIIGIG